MDLALFDRTLAEALGDPTGFNHTAESRLLATLSAIRAYSQYFPCLRRISTGAILLTIPAGETEVKVVGGLWKPGDTITLDAFGLHPEDAEIEDVDFEEEGIHGVATSGVLLLTLTAPTALKHRGGGIVQKKPQSGNPLAGLDLKAGQDTYLLPRDWVNWEKESFDIAIGAKSQVRKHVTFYDAVYSWTNMMSGVGLGGSTNFSGAYLAGGTPFNRFATIPATGQPLAQPAPEVVFRFSEGDPGLLTVSPTPILDKTLDFFYNGVHTPRSLPERGFEACIDYARYVRLKALAGDFAALENYTEDDVSERPDQSALALMKQAEEALELFYQKTRYRPYVVIG